MKHGNTKGTNEAPTTDLTKMEIYKLPDKEFKIIVLKKLNELQENINKQIDKIRKTIPEQNYKFNKRRKP